MTLGSPCGGTHPGSAGEIARNATTRAGDAASAARELVSQLGGGDAVLVVAFADWRLDAAGFASELQRGFGPTPTVGCTGHGVIGSTAIHQPTAVATAFYGKWLRVGLGVAQDLPQSAVVRSREAVSRATAALGTTPEALDPKRHVAFTLVDGTSGYDDAFCIGSAAAAPQVRFVGGSASTAFGGTTRAFVWANGEALTDAGVVCVLETARRFEAITSQHMVATKVRTVVTGSSGRIIDELDGIPAAQRLRKLVGLLGGTLEEPQPTSFTLARFVDGAPYIRSITRIEGDRIHLATSVDAGDVLYLMQPGDLIGRTNGDLLKASGRLGKMEALIAFCCVGRHLEATTAGQEAAFMNVYTNYPTTGFLSFGEQTGMVLVNHTLTALAFGGRLEQ